MSKCLSVKVVDERRYQCKLEAYHGGNCEYVYSPDLTARAMVKKRATCNLVADWEELDKQPMAENTPIVRGWLMDELECRNKAAFDCWLESNEPSPRKFFCV